jgi:signal transduction histidine kinase
VNNGPEQQQQVVLVVEDEPSIIDLITAVLASSASAPAARVVPARGWAQAQRALGSVRPALITLDLVLPEEDGMEVLRALRARPDLADVPVIIISAQVDSASQRRAFLAGASDFVAKPFSVDLLDAKLQAWLRLSRCSSARQQVRDFAHEARNPLAAISAAAQVLSRDGLDEGMRRRLCAAIVSEAERLGRMIQAYLGPPSAGMGADAGALPPRPHAAPARVLADVLDVNLTDPAARARVRRQISTPLPEVQVDPDRLRQMLLNLLDNALCATAAGGEVTIDAYVDEAGVGLAVRDSGVGIAAANLPRIFDDGFTTRGTGAYGLGLGITRRLCQESGATLNVLSSEGQGSTFLLWLPRKGPPA